jgi:hypothetical protein
MKFADNGAKGELQVVGETPGQLISIDLDNFSTGLLDDAKVGLYTLIISQLTS